jgi:REP-associated tyrosine transposase
MVQTGAAPNLGRKPDLTVRTLDMRPTFTTTCLIEDPHEVTRYDLGGHTHYKLDYHFVWRTKFNRKILGPVLTPFLVDQMESICRSKKVKRLGLAIAANHVHLCLRLRPSHSPAQVMGWIKSTTSKNAFERFPDLQKQYGLHRLWSTGYHVESLGDKTVFAILAYIGRQDEKHDLRALEEYMATVDGFLQASDTVGEAPDE